MVVSDRLRFAWNTKMTLLQMIGIYLFSIMYSVIPFVVWVEGNERFSDCSHISTLGKNSKKIFAFLGVGLFLPTFILNILYFATLCKLRKQWRKRMRFLRQKDSFVKEKSSAKMSDVFHINQQRRNQRGEKIKFCDSPKLRTQGILILDPLRSLDHCDSLDISPTIDDTKPSEVNVSSSLICQCETNDINETLSGLPDAITSFEPTDLNTAAHPGVVPPSAKATALPKFENTNFRINPDPYSTRREDTPKRPSQLNRGYKSDYQRQSLCLIGLILLLIDVSIFPAIIVRSIPVSISLTVRFTLTLLVFNNSLVNPWIYALQSKDFRRALKDNIVKIGEWIASFVKFR